MAEATRLDHSLRASSPPSPTGDTMPAPAALALPAWSASMSTTLAPVRAARSATLTPTMPPPITTTTNSETREADIYAVRNDGTRRSALVRVTRVRTSSGRSLPEMRQRPDPGGLRDEYEKYSSSVARNLRYSRYSAAFGGITSVPN